MTVPDSGVSADAGFGTSGDSGVPEDASGGSFDGGLSGGDAQPTGPLGNWQYDDCFPGRTNLNDLSPNWNTAFRSVNVGCSPGIRGLAVSLSNPVEDIVTVPDQPDFRFDSGVTVAGWFNPNSVTQTSSLLRKRDDSTSSFALLLHQGHYMFVVNLGRGRAASVTASARAVAGQWTHVAGTYDGAMLRLYIDGVEVANTRARGSVQNLSGPVVMGNDGSHRLFPGLMDNGFLDRRALSLSEVQDLNCIRVDPTVVATPAVSAPTLPGVPAFYDVTITNNDSAFCPATDWVYYAYGFVPGLETQPSYLILPQIPPGGTAQLRVAATADATVDPGTYDITFWAVRDYEVGVATVNLVVAAGR
ncbi:MAG: LamG domain-containing protein [Myxococcota bacterium]